MSPSRASARTLALRMLGRREYTSAEIREKLLDREVSADDADAVIEALTSEGLIDDRRAASAHVRTASRVKRRGLFRIRRELEARGVAPVIIKDALGELPADAEHTAIRKILVAKRVPARLDPTTKRKLFQHLLRR